MRIDSTKYDVLLLGYSRFAGIQNVLNSLDSDRINTLYLSLDGTDNEVVSRIQSDIILFVRDFGKTHKIPVFVLQRDRNLGVAVAIIQGIDWFFSQVDRGVILEDDLVVDPSFFNYLDLAYGYLDSEKSFLMISGNQFSKGFSRQFNTQGSQLYLVNYPLIWGWATTSEKWKLMKKGILEQSLTRKSLFNKVENFWRIGSKRVLAGVLDTWDIPLASFMRSSQSFCLIPPVNLISNHGVDEFAVHTLDLNFPLMLPLEKFSNTADVDFEYSRSLVPYFNSELEKTVFKIRYKHTFLPLYERVLSFSTRNQRRSRLADRLIT